MANKIMLVEDDNNLREIYGARLLAEGYEIVSAKDGEEALALAVKEKPNLIIADIMMPKISGFDMLDILRSTPETKSTKVIMMTALNQAEDKEHADRLGADRYLVKSQVTLEDVVGVAKELLVQAAASAPNAPVQPSDLAENSSATIHQGGDSAAPASENPAAPAPATETTNAPVPPPPPEPNTQASDPVITNPGVTNIPVTVNDASTTPGELPAAPQPINDTASTTTTQTANDKVLADAVAQISSSESKIPGAPSVNDNSAGSVPASQPDNSSMDGTKVEVRTSKVIQPLTDVSQAKPDIHELAAREEAKEQAAAGQGGAAPPQTAGQPIQPNSGIS